MKLSFPNAKTRAGVGKFTTRNCPMNKKLPELFGFGSRRFLGLPCSPAIPTGRIQDYARRTQLVGQDGIRNSIGTRAHGLPSDGGDEAQ